MRITPPATKPPVIELVDAAGNPFLRGAFAPVRDELDASDLAVEVFADEIAWHEQGRCSATSDTPILPVPSSAVRDGQWR